MYRGSCKPSNTKAGRHQDFSCVLDDFTGINPLNWVVLILRVCVVCVCVHTPNCVGYYGQGLQKKQCLVKITNTECDAKVTGCCTNDRWRDLVNVCVTALDLALAPSPRPTAGN